MKLYYAPGACSLGIHYLLEEIGATFEALPVIIRDGEQFTSDYVDLNPKSKVPTLVRDDGSVLTEFGAIASWLAQTIGAEQLRSPDVEHAVRTTETLDFVVSCVHMQGFTRMFRPVKFTPHEADYPWVQDQGRQIVMKAMTVLSDRLGDRPFMTGDRLSAADGAMFYVLVWGVYRMKMDLPPNIVALFDRYFARPAAQRALAREGLL